MPIEIIKTPIKKSKLREIASGEFGDIVKAVVDAEREIMAIGGELHSDEEILLVERENSKRENTWGINLCPDKSGEEFVEFDSMINLKPFLGNRTRGIDDSGIKEKIKKIVAKLIEE